MTSAKTEALTLLGSALTAASDSGLFDDELASEVHPDIINQFCDAVTRLQDATTGERDMCHTLPNLDAMMAWENGELSEEETIVLFQALVDNDLAWSLQGMYGRQAERLLEAGLIFPPKA